MNEFITLLDVDLILKIVLSIIMFGVGLSLKIKDFIYIRNNKRLLMIGLLIKVVFLPFLGFLLLDFVELSALFKLGIMLLLLSPGGTTTNLITYWFDGTIALTIFLTTLSGLLSIVILPVFVNVFSLYYFGKGTTFSLPAGETMTNIFVIILIPSLVGLYVHEHFESWAKKIENVVKPVSVMLLGLVYLIKFLAPTSAGGVGISWDDFIELCPVLLIINLSILFLGFYFSKWFGENSQDSMTIGIEMGIQNAALAILVGGVFLSNQELVKPALIYAMFSFWTTTAFAIIIKSRFYE